MSRYYVSDFDPEDPEPGFGVFDSLDSGFQVGPDYSTEQEAQAAADALNQEVAP